MSRPVALSIPILLFIAVLLAIGVAAFEPALPGDAQAELDRYLAYQQGRSGVRPAVRQIVSAIRPGRFTASMSRASYGDSPYYKTSNHFQEPADPAETVSGVSRIHFYSESGRPLPYPPERLWCVLLDPGGQAATRIVFVALHQDLYNADWIVHESAAGAANSEVEVALTGVGCAAETG